MRLKELGHSFDDHTWLFRGLDAEVRPGELAALVGPSGAGKSTLLAIVAGQLVPTRGRVERPDGRVQWVFQNPNGVARRTVLDHVCLPFLAAGHSERQARARGNELLDEFGLGGMAASAFSQLSGGEAQRLMLARALACRPAVLLVDEPTAQLDQTTSRRVSASLSLLASRGVVVLVATHDPGVVDQCETILDLTEYCQ